MSRAEPGRAGPTRSPTDERYLWLNLVQAVGRGGYEDGRMVCQMYEIR